MMNETALVTGGTDGIRKAIALGLAHSGCRVVVAGRDADKGVRVESEIRRSTRNAHVHFVQADLSLTREADRLAAEISRGCSTLSYLVHSAGIVRGQWELTTEGLESNFAVNYVSRFALSLRLLPLLAASGRPSRASRIVIINGAATNGKIYFDDVNLTGRFGTVRAILQSCQANDAFTVEFADRLVQAGEARATISCLKVGVVRTNIRRQFPRWMKWLVPLIMDPLFALSPQEVAGEGLRLLLGPEFEGATGGLFMFIRRFKAMGLPQTLRDPHMRSQLWQLSERIAFPAKGPLSLS